MNKLDRELRKLVKETSMTTYKHSDRVETTVNAPAAWDGAFSAPAGTRGTIVDGPDQFDNYSVLLDGDPDQMPVSYKSAELRASHVEDDESLIKPLTGYQLFMIHKYGR